MDSVARAAQLAPRLAARAFETVRARRLLPENVALLRDTGLFRVLQPARWGGDEASLHRHLDVVEAVASGCGATGWCLGVMHAHAWLTGLFAEAAQRDVCDLHAINMHGLLALKTNLEMYGRALLGHVPNTPVL